MIKHNLNLKLSRTDWLNLSLLAFFGVVLAQLFQVIYRYSYAPPASNVNFLLNLAPVFILFLSAFVLSEKLLFAKIVGIGIATLGMILVLANWERPSTFSPFSRYPKEETFILLAAFCWALFTVHARKLLRRYDPLTLTFLTLSLGFIPLLILAFVKDGVGVAFQVLPSDWTIVLVLGTICTGILYLLWYLALKEVEASDAGVVLFVTPVFITSLIGIERKIGYFGPNPIIIKPVVIGSILIVAGVFATWSRWVRRWKATEPEKQLVFRHSWLEKILIFFAIGSLLFGFAAFFLPIKTNYLQAVLLNDNLYDSKWQTIAYETVGGFLILLVGIVNSVAGWKYLKAEWSALQLLGWAAFSGLLLLSQWLAGDTVFFSWVPWIPAEVQHAIGTEYVRMWEVPLINIPMLISSIMTIAFIGLSILLVSISIITVSRRHKSLYPFFKKRGI